MDTIFAKILVLPVSGLIFLSINLHIAPEQRCNFREATTGLKICEKQSSVTLPIKCFCINHTQASPYKLWLYRMSPLIALRLASLNLIDRVDGDGCMNWL